MKNQKEIYEALLAGETLVSRGGTEVYLKTSGELSIPSAFLNSQGDWSIKKKPNVITFFEVIQSIHDREELRWVNIKELRAEADIYTKTGKTKVIEVPK